nr:hypothetical protein [uncultured Moellerella sp.]
MSVYEYEVLKEYVYIVSDMPGNIKARISKSLQTGELRWECSHFYKDRGGQKAYEPCHNTTRLEDCKSELDSYIKKFDPATAEPNIDY